MKGNSTMDEFKAWVEPLMREHLINDIIPFWTQPSMLGNPIGLFPTYASQSGVPDYSEPFYVRMHGRQTYGYLAAYLMLQREDLLSYGLAGLKRLEACENPEGGYFSTFTFDGKPRDTPISIQDQCYSAFPYVMAYRVTGNKEYLDKIWSFISFIDAGPYQKGENVYMDSLTPDLKNEVYFESKTMNIVSALDFLNAILIPALRVTPSDELTIERKNLLVKWVKLLVDEFYGNGIFWNEKENRSDWQAKHTDLGHTSKAYGILYKANDLFRSWGMPTMYENVMAGYPEIVKAAARPGIGWLTDFDHSPTTFQKQNLQWWRHVLIDQTIYLYAHDYPELIPLLKQGVEAWFSCDYVDRTRECRGIREGLSPDGHTLSNDNNIACKANCWKNAYHEVEHVLTLTGGDA